jgi:CHAT domain-containing protein
MGYPHLARADHCDGPKAEISVDLCDVPSTGDLLYEVAQLGSSAWGSSFHCKDQDEFPPKGASADPVQCYWRDAFTRESVRDVISANADDSWNLVLIATHGLGVQETKTFSGLVVTPTSLDHIWDGVILSEEMLSASLRADWVVLATCNSGGASDSISEVYGGLARSFISAGADVVTVSQWSVDQVATESLLENVVKNRVVAGDSPSHALTLAMQDLRKQAGASLPSQYAHPYYWAAFVSFGN